VNRKPELAHEHDHERHSTWGFCSWAWTSRLIGRGPKRGAKWSPDRKAGHRAAVQAGQATEKTIEGFISAQKQLAPLASKLEASGGKVDSETQKEVDRIAKSSGFATIDELGEVTDNISLVLAGLDQQTGQFTEPPDLIRREMEKVKGSTELSEEDKAKTLTAMQEALKSVPPVQFKENVVLVKQYQKELDEVLRQEQGSQQDPTSK
jgi:hypothetical protein